VIDTTGISAGQITQQVEEWVEGKLAELPSR
jgi:hypothetical protein